MDSRFDGVKGWEHPDWFSGQDQDFLVAWVSEYCIRTNASLNESFAAWARGDEMPPTPPMPRTTWYPGDIAPVREGLYECRNSSCVEEGCESPHLVWFPEKWSIHTTDGFEWRGLTRKVR